ADYESAQKLLILTEKREVVKPKVLEVEELKPLSEIEVNVCFDADIFGHYKSDVFEVSTECLSSEIVQKTIHMKSRKIVKRSESIEDILKLPLEVENNVCFGFEFRRGLESDVVDVCFAVSDCKSLQETVKLEKVRAIVKPVEATIMSEMQVPVTAREVHVDSDVVKSAEVDAINVSCKCSIFDSIEESVLLEKSRNNDVHACMQFLPGSNKLPQQESSIVVKLERTCGHDFSDSVLNLSDFLFCSVHLKWPIKVKDIHRPERPKYLGQLEPKRYDEIPVVTVAVSFEFVKQRTQKIGVGSVFNSERSTEQIELTEDIVKLTCHMHAVRHFSIFDKCTVFNLCYCGVQTESTNFAVNNSLESVQLTDVLLPEKVFIKIAAHLKEQIRKTVSTVQKPALIAHPQSVIADIDVEAGEELATTDAIVDVLTSFDKTNLSVTEVSWDEIDVKVSLDAVMDEEFIEATGPTFHYQLVSLVVSIPSVMVSRLIHEVNTLNLHEQAEIVVAKRSDTEMQKLSIRLQKETKIERMMDEKLNEITEEKKQKLAKKRGKKTSEGFKGIKTEQQDEYENFTFILQQKSIESDVPSISELTVPLKKMTRKASEAEFEMESDLKTTSEDDASTYTPSAEDKAEKEIGEKKKKIPKALVIPAEINSKYGDKSVLVSQTIVTTEVTMNEEVAKVEASPKSLLSATFSTKIDSVKRGKSASHKFSFKGDTEHDQTGLPPVPKAKEETKDVELVFGQSEGQENAERILLAQLVEELAVIVQATSKMHEQRKRTGEEELDRKEKSSELTEIIATFNGVEQLEVFEIIALHILSEGTALKVQMRDLKKGKKLLKVPAMDDKKIHSEEEKKKIQPSKDRKTEEDDKLVTKEKFEEIWLNFETEKSTHIVKSEEYTEFEVIIKEHTEKIDLTVNSQVSRKVRKVKKPVFTTDDTLEDFNATDLTLKLPSKQRDVAEAIETSVSVNLPLVRKLSVYDELAKLEEAPSTVKSKQKESYDSVKKKRLGFLQIPEQEIIALRGDTVTVECELVDQSDFLWLINNKTVDQNSKCVEEVDELVRRLKIINIAPEDNETIITAKAGDVVAETVIHVEDTPAEITERLPRRSFGRCGKDVTLSVTVTHPAHTVVWKFNGEELPNEPEKYVTTKDNNIYTLIIKDATYDSAGRYSVQIDSSETSTVLVMQGAPVVENQKPENINFDIYENLVLNIPYKAEPEPTVDCFFNGKPLFLGTKLQLEITNDLIRLCKRRTSKDDSGEYTFKISNEFGSVTTTFNAVIKGVPNVPQNLRYTNPFVDKVGLEWDAPVDDGSGEITGYLIQKKEIHHRAFHRVLQVQENKTSCLIEELDADTEYIFRIAAINKYGIGEFAEFPIIRTSVATEESKEKPESEESIREQLYEQESLENVEIEIVEKLKSEKEREITVYEIFEPHETKSAKVEKSIEECQVMKVSGKVDKIQAVSLEERSVLPESDNKTTLTEKQELEKLESAAESETKKTCVAQKEIERLDTSVVETELLSTTEKSEEISLKEKPKHTRQKGIKKEKTKEKKVAAESKGESPVSVEIPTEYFSVKLNEDIGDETVFETVKIETEKDKIERDVDEKRIKDKVIEADLFLQSTAAVRNVDKCVSLSDSEAVVLSLKEIAVAKRRKLKKEESVTRTENLKKHLEKSKSKRSKKDLKGESDDEDKVSITLVEETIDAEAGKWIHEQLLRKPEAEKTEEDAEKKQPFGSDHVYVKKASSHDITINIPRVTTWETPESEEVTQIEEVPLKTAISSIGTGVSIIQQVQKRRYGFASPPDQEIMAFRNDTVKIECELYNEKDTISWTVNGKSATTDTRCKEVVDGYLRILQIEKVVPDDTGTIITANVGEHYAESRLVIIEIPAEITEKLPHKTTGKLDNQLKLSVTISHPTQNFEWFFNNEPISENDVQYEAYLEGNICELLIKNLTYDQAGRYTARINSAETSTILTVEGKPVLIHDQAEIKTIDLESQENLMLTIPFKAMPEPILECLFNHEKISDNSKTQLHIFNDTACFCKRKVNRNDTGLYTIKIKNDYGEVSQTFSVNIKDVPEAPSNIRIVDIDHSSAQVEWDSPRNDSGCAIKNYIIEKKEATRRTYHKVAQVSSKKLHYFMDDLKTDTSYTVRIAAENKYGVGEYAECCPFKTTSLYKVPTVVHPPTISNITQESCILEWPEVADNGGSPIYGYDVYLRKDNSEWMKLNEELIFIRQYTVTNIEAGPCYTFKIEATNEAGLTSDCSVSSEPITIAKAVANLPVLNLPTIEVISGNAVLVHWTEAESDECNIISYVVQYKSEKSTFWTAKEIEHPPVEIGDLKEGVSYVFKIAPKFGSETGEFSEETIPIRVIAARKPKIVKSIKDVSVPCKRELKLECRATGEPTPEYIWYKNDREIIPTSENVEIISEGYMSVLLIHQTSMDDAGLYKCEVVNDFDSVVSTATVTITEVRAHFVTSFSEYLEVNEGEEVVFSCELSDADASVTWFKNGIHLSPSHRIIIEKNDVERKLIIKDAVVEDSGEYECSTIDRRTRSQAELVVKEEQPQIKRSPRDQIVTEFGSTVSLTCETTKPVKTLTWFKNGREIRSQPQKFYMTMEKTIATLTICALEPSDSGEYKAVLHEDEQSATAKVEFKVPPLIKLASIPPNNLFKLHAGTDFDLELLYDGFPEPNIVVLLNNALPDKKRFRMHTYANKLSLRLKDISRSDSGILKIIVENEIDQASLDIQLHVISVPSEPLNLSASNITDHSLTLKWQKPEKDNGSPIINYVVERKIANINRWRNVAKLGCDEHEFLVDDLYPNENYAFRILAANEAGEGTPSNVIDVATESETEMDNRKKYQVRKLLEKPQISEVILFEDNDTVVIRWKAVENAEEYVLEQQNVDNLWVQVDVVASLEYSCDIMSSTKYRVLAKKGNQLSIPSEPSEVITYRKNKVLEESEQETPSEQKLEKPNDMEEVQKKAEVTAKSEVLDDKIDQSESQDVNEMNRIAEEPEEKVEKKQQLKSQDKQEALVETEKEVAIVPERSEEPQKLEKVEEVDFVYEENNEIKCTTEKMILKEEKIDTVKAKLEKVPEEMSKDKKKEKKFKSKSDEEIEQKVKTVIFEKENISNETESKSEVRRFEVEEFGEDKRFVEKKEEKLNVIPVKGTILAEYGTKNLDIKVEVKGTYEQCIWTKNNRLVSRELVHNTATSSVLRIEHVDEQTAGNYLCTVTNQFEKEQAEVVVIVTDKPKIEFDSAIIESKVGEPIKIHADIAGLPLPECIWLKDGAKLVTDDNVSIAFKNNAAVLAIKRANAECSGLYKLIAENSSGKTERELRLLVKGAPSIPVGPLEVSNITNVSCKLAWNQPLLDGNSKLLGYCIEKRDAKKSSWAFVMRTTSTVAVITGLSDTITYRFRVAAENAFGTGQYLEIEKPVQLAKISTSAKPQIEKAPQNETCKLGDRLTLCVEFTGNPSPKVRWYKNDKEVVDDLNIHTTKSETNSMITIKKLCQNDEGNYQIVLENDCGTVQHNFDLTVLSKPVIIDTDKYKEPQVFNIHENINFQLSFTG
ncbi:unnamed protein product, partial [Thelazia callipaeda]|uniref:DUF3794 domain-containing protein n=1 Tax=Thelazia callipaeda TaxID=103827 RepID=A0A0N5D7D9_THECL